MNPALIHIHETLNTIRNQINADIIGQNDLIEKLLITFFAGGHALLEWVPGLGKTKTIRTFARVLGLNTGRISFTPDLLPSDLTGNEIYRATKSTFEIRKGPIFTNILLADEINRTPPKVQSALLEAMEEKKVTIGDKTLELPSPFVVFATQNPLEHEWTYPLPEAQLDRFLMKINLDYPHPEDEKNIFRQECEPLKKWEKTETELSINEKDIGEMIDYIIKSVRVDSKIYDYISDILEETRKLAHSWEKQILAYGASTRAGLALVRAAKVRAVMENRDFVLPEDIKYLAHSILDHRLSISYMSSSEGMNTFQVTEKILDSVKIP